LHDVVPNAAASLTAYLDHAINESSLSKSQISSKDDRLWHTCRGLAFVVIKQAMHRLAVIHLC